MWEVLFRQASLSLVRWGRQWQEQESGENCCLTLQDPGPRVRVSVSCESPEKIWHMSSPQRPPLSTASYRRLYEDQ